MSQYTIVFNWDIENHVFYLCASDDPIKYVFTMHIWLSMLGSIDMLSSITFPDCCESPPEGKVVRSR